MKVEGRILDASVAIAWYLPEVFSRPARAWLQLLLEERARLIVPSLHFWEVGNVLRSHVRRGELEAQLAQEIFDAHRCAPLEVREPDRGLTLTNALALEATVYDAVYATLAIELDLPLLTAEKPTRPWLVRLGPRAESIHAG